MADETSDSKLTDFPSVVGPLTPTVIDNNGIERIVGPAAAHYWEPAQVNPTPEAIAHGEEINAKLAARRGERLAALSSDVLPADGSQAASQPAPAPAEKK